MADDQTLMNWDSNGILSTYCGDMMTTHKYVVMPLASRNQAHEAGSGG